MSEPPNEPVWLSRWRIGAAALPVVILGFFLAAALIEGRLVGLIILPFLIVSGHKLRLTLQRRRIVPFPEALVELLKSASHRH